MRKTNNMINMKNNERKSRTLSKEVNYFVYYNDAGRKAVVNNIYFIDSAGRRYEPLYEYDKPDYLLSIDLDVMAHYYNDSDLYIKVTEENILDDGWTIIANGIYGEKLKYRIITIEENIFGAKILPNNTIDGTDIHFDKIHIDDLSLFPLILTDVISIEGDGISVKRCRYKKIRKYGKDGYVYQLLVFSYAYDIIGKSTIVEVIMENNHSKLMRVEVIDDDGHISYINYRVTGLNRYK